VTESTSFYTKAALAIGCPLAIVLAFPKANISALAFLALAPLFWLWSKSSWKSALLWGWLSGFIMCALLFSWTTNSLGDEIGGFRYLTLVLFAAIEGFSVAIVALMTSLMARGRFGTAMVFAAPAAWLIWEALRTIGSVSMPFGQLGAVAPHLTWLLPMAAYAGVYGLTAIIVLVNGAVAGLAFGEGRARLAGAVTLGVVAIAIAAGNIGRAQVAVPAPTTHVAVVQGDISQRVKWSPAVFSHTIEVYTQLTREAARRGARIVIWPETAITEFPIEKPELLAGLERLARSTRTWILAGTLDAPAPGATYNVVIELTPFAGLGGVYQKHILVPFAEFLPLDWLFRKLPLFDQASTFAHGPGPGVLQAGDLQLGVLICFESAYSSYARATTLAGASALLVVTDDAWFGTSAGPYMHADMAVIDAVQTGRWVIRGADTGISQIIDPKGQIRDEIPLDTEGMIVSEVGAPIDTPYLHYGAGWLLGLALGAIAWGFVAQRPERRRRAVK
jgi:apolipoprotein N-acyltransferase